MSKSTAREPDALRWLWLEFRPEGLPGFPQPDANWRPERMPTSLPPHFRDFLELWWHYGTGDFFRPVAADDPLWETVPLILQSGRTAGSGHQLQIEGMLQFVTFWRRNGQLAHSAVTAQMVEFPGPRVRQRGQSVRDAYLTKPATWITRLTMAGFFRQIELLNVLGGPPAGLARPQDSLSDQTHRPCAWLETFTVAERPRPASPWQHVKALLSGYRRDQSTGV